MTPNGNYANYVLPLGNTITGGNPNSPNYQAGCYGDFNTTNPTLGFTGIGIFGASYPTAAGLFKNLLGNCRSRAVSTAWTIRFRPTT